MARNKIADLRDHLFATLEDLRDPDKKPDLERTRATVEVAQTIINSAKVEVDFLKALGENAGDGEFFGRGRQLAAPQGARGGTPQRENR